MAELLISDFVYLFLLLYLNPIGILISSRFRCLVILLGVGGKALLWTSNVELCKSTRLVGSEFRLIDYKEGGFLNAIKVYGNSSLLGFLNEEEFGNDLAGTAVQGGIDILGEHTI
jgi:hypothetical protein